MSNWKNTGCLTLEDIEFPSEDRIQRGPVAIFECPENIPCNPCEEICPSGAVLIGKINCSPKVDFEKCTGCGLCVQVCPGLAIYLLKYKEESAIITLPYEYLPLPIKGDIVNVLNRKGEKIGEGKVIKIISRDKSIGDAPIVSIEIPKYIGLEARDIEVKTREVKE